MSTWSGIRNKLENDYLCPVPHPVFCHQLLGKRRLLALDESMEQELDWVRAFYIIRMQAEGLMEITKN